MSTFQDMVAADNAKVFCNPAEFGERRTVRYDGEEYVDIVVTITNAKQQRRQQRVSDHVQGLFMVNKVLHVQKSDLGGHEPEVKQSIFINDREGGGGFFEKFTVAACSCDMGMLTIELEAISQ